MTPLVLVELTQAELDVGQAEPSPALACRGFLYPLVNIQMAIENGHKIVDSLKMVIFHRFLYVYQAG